MAGILQESDPTVAHVQSASSAWEEVGAGGEQVTWRGHYLLTARAVALVCEGAAQVPQAFQVIWEGYTSGEVEVLCDQNRS